MQFRISQIMKRNGQQNSSAAHQKILKLLESLQKRENVQEDPLMRKIQGFKETINTQQQIMHDKFNSVSTSLHDMEKGLHPLTNYSQLRMMNSYNQNMNDLENQAHQNTLNLIHKIQAQQKSLNDQILSHKVKLTHEEQYFRSQLLSSEKDFNQLIHQVRHNVKTEQRPNYKEISLKSKLHGLHRQIVQLNQDQVRCQLLEESEKKMGKLIDEQQENLNRNFRMHCDTLQKLMKSISQRME